jgi:Fe-S cluster assembly iron-binding protein IscA
VNRGEGTNSLRQLRALLGDDSCSIWSNVVYAGICSGLCVVLTCQSDMMMPRHNAKVIVESKSATIHLTDSAESILN